MRFLSQSLTPCLPQLDDSEQANNYDQWNNSNPEEHEPSFAHELIAGAASFEAAKAYENHVAQNGKHGSYHCVREE